MSQSDALIALSKRLNIFRERIASISAATNMSVDSQAIAIAMVTTTYSTLFEEIADFLCAAQERDHVR